MGLDSCKPIKGRIPDSSQTRPLWHTLTAHSLKFLLSATTEGVPTWRRGGGGEGTPLPPAREFPFHHALEQSTLQKSGVGVGWERRAREEKGWGGSEAKPFGHIWKALWPPKLWPSTASPTHNPLHPINRNSPHFLLWRFGARRLPQPCLCQDLCSGGACGVGCRLSPARLAGHGVQGYRPSIGWKPGDVCAGHRAEHL